MGFSKKQEICGGPGGIRTPDLPLRRRPLYPAELRARLWGPQILQHITSLPQLPVLEPRNILCGPGTNMVNFALHRNFPIPLSETSTIEFRFEAFKFLNRSHFRPVSPSETATQELWGGQIGTTGRFSSG